MNFVFTFVAIVAGGVVSAKLLQIKKRGSCNVAEPYVGPSPGSNIRPSTMLGLQEGGSALTSYTSGTAKSSGASSSTDKNLAGVQPLTFN